VGRSRTPRGEPPTASSRAAAYNDHFTCPIFLLLLCSRLPSPPESRPISRSHWRREASRHGGQEEVGPLRRRRSRSRSRAAAAQRLLQHRFPLVSCGTVSITPSFGPHLVCNLKDCFDVAVCGDWWSGGAICSIDSFPMLILIFMAEELLG
jgi:hypothetical protein